MLSEQKLQTSSLKWKQGICLIQSHWLYQTCFFFVVLFSEFFLLEFIFDYQINDFSFEIMIKNLAIIAGLNLLLTGLFHAVRGALLLSELFFLVVGISNYFVICFRGYGIVFMDFYAVKTAANVAGGYQYRISLEFLLYVFLEVILLLATFFLLPKRKHAYLQIKYLFVSLLGILYSVLFFFWINYDSVFFKDVSSLSWDHQIGIRDYGYVLYFLSNAGKATVDEPEGYSVKKVEEEILKSAGSSRADTAETENEKEPDGKQTSGSAPSVTHPNLIMIMNESFADLRTLGTLKTNREVMPFFDSLKKDTIKGTAYSSVYGGYTANSEFEFLTGCSKLFLPGSPYLQYIDDYIPSLASNLKQQGYDKTIAMHPYHPSGYNRNRIYPLLGFDSFLSLEDFSAEKLVRKYVGDMEDYKKIEELYEKKEKGTSLCVFNVTMQNHNAYDDKEYVFDEPVRVTNFQADSAVEQYLSLMHMSDQALEELVHYFQKEEEPTMILLFGDHQPHLSNQFYQAIMGNIPVLFSEEEVMMEHEVPFLIWANYDIPEKTIEKTSLNYLSTLLLQTAGLKMTDFNRYLLELEKQIPVISACGCYDAKGKLYHYPAEDDKGIQKLLAMYEMVNYNYLFDTKRLTKYVSGYD